MGSSEFIGQDNAFQWDTWCIHCSYNLRGLTSDICPECGKDISRLRDPRSRIPWARAKGWRLLPAYWLTVLLSTHNHRRLGEEMVRPVSFAKAQWFRWITILQVQVMAMVMAPWFFDAISNRERESIIPAVQAVWPVFVVGLGFLLFLVAATGLPSYFFHPNSLSVRSQNRAIALSYYPAGQLSLLWPAICVVWWFKIAGFSLYTNELVGLFAGCYVLGVLLLCYVSHLKLAYYAFAGVPGRVMMLAILLPVLWLAAAAIFVCLLPVSVAYVVLVVHLWSGG